MYGSKHLTNVALFPLCDAGSVLIDALCNASDAPATRGDALVFAWRLALPDGMDVAAAANAVLVVALSVPRTAWNRQQLLIVRELMVLAGKGTDMPEGVNGDTAETLVTVSPKSLLGRHRKPEVAREITAESADIQEPPDRRVSGTRTNTRTNDAKQSKPWWKLVGRDATDDHRGQRKTRTERVSREP